MKKDLLASARRVRDPVLFLIPTLTVWNTRTSSTGEMVFKGGPPQSANMAMEVVANDKIAIVLGSGDGLRHRSLVVIEMVDNIWIRKDLRIEKADNFWMRRDLAQWQLPRFAETCMASDKDVWVILKLDTFTVYTSSDNGKELKMPVTGNGNRWEVIVNESSLPLHFQRFGFQTLHRAGFQSSNRYWNRYLPVEEHQH